MTISQPKTDELLSSPATAAGWAERAQMLQKAGREQEALAAAAAALKLDPSRADMWGCIGFLLLERGRWREAGDYLREAVNLSSDDATLRSHYAVALMEQDEYVDAYSQTQQALAAEPTNTDALYMTGELLCRMGHYDRAIVYYERARATGSLGRAATFGQGFATFMMDDVDAGMKLLAKADPAEDFSGLPDWDGKPDPDLHLLLCGHYGFGDIMQFIRYVGQLQGRVRKVTLSLPYHLVGLMRDSFPNYSVHAYHVPENKKASLPSGVSEMVPQDATARCFYMNVPHLLDSAFDAMAKAVPYLHANATKIAAMRGKLAHMERPHIGLVWSGNVFNQNNHNRSIPFETLAPLIKVAGPHLVSLQMDGSRHAEAAGIFDCGPSIQDFTDTAALMNEMDLIITICSAPAHLAGGMGKSTWTMLAFNPDWRWLIERDDSIWYPTMRLFRMTRPKGWADVVEKVASELKKFLAGDRSVLPPATKDIIYRRHPHALILPNNLPRN